MKQKILLFTLIPFFLVACFSHKDEKLCTMIYVTIGISVKDTLNNPVVLEKYEVKVVNTNQLLPVHSDSASMAQGLYTLLTDSEISSISEHGTTLRFTGYKDSQIIVTGDYIVNQDGCHVNLISGSETLIVK
jgi:hypothetical protein